MNSIISMDSTEANTILISIFWGLGIAILLRKLCDNGNCVIVDDKNKTQKN